MWKWSTIKTFPLKLPFNLSYLHKLKYWFTNFQLASYGSNMGCTCMLMLSNFPLPSQNRVLLGGKLLQNTSSHDDDSAPRMMCSMTHQSQLCNTIIVLMEIIFEPKNKNVTKTRQKVTNNTVLLLSHLWTNLKFCLQHNVNKNSSSSCVLN